MKQTEEICVKVVPMSEMRYPSVGDYWYDENGVLQVRIADLGEKRMNRCVLMHELNEVFVTEHHGIIEQDIMAFDVRFEKEREEGKWRDDQEPGDDPRAPYRKEHRFSENCERQLALALDVDWEEYTERVNSL